MTLDPTGRRSGKIESDPSHRSPAHRDRDRILYSEAFRRLGGVTQVALGTPPMLLHNRLTHSLKVEQVGLSVYSKLHDQHPDLPKRVDRESVAAACLAHDLGHPPFGHAGEQELHALVTCRKHRTQPRPYVTRIADPCDRCLLEDGFEGNAQSFRILTALAVHKSWRDVQEDRKTFGMDLTASTLRASTKYPWLRGDGPKPAKWGAYDLDREVLEGLAGGSQELTLAAQIMDWADDISYAVHDLEDFYRIGYIPLERYFQPDREQANDGGPPFTENEALTEFLDYVVQVSGTEIGEETRATLVNLTALFPARRFEGEPREISTIDELRSQMITQFINATSLGGGDLVVEDLQRSLNGVVKQFTWYHVIHNPLLANIQTGQRRVLRELFHGLRHQVLAVYPVGGKESQTPASARRLPATLRWGIEVALAQTSEATRSQRIHRGLIDYIAGLSDLEAYEQHSVLKGREPQGHL